MAATKNTVGKVSIPNSQLNLNKRQPAPFMPRMPSRPVLPSQLITGTGTYPGRAPAPAPKPPLTGNFQPKPQPQPALPVSKPVLPSQLPSLPVFQQPRPTPVPQPQPPLTGNFQPTPAPAPAPTPIQQPSPQPQYEILPPLGIMESTPIQPPSTPGIDPFLQNAYELNQKYGQPMSFNDWLPGFIAGMNAPIEQGPTPGRGSVPGPMETQYAGQPATPAVSAIKGI